MKVEMIETTNKDKFKETLKDYLTNGYKLIGFSTSTNWEATTQYNAILKLD